VSTREKVQATIQTIYGKVFNEGRGDLLPGLISGPYIQHNPQFPNGPAPLMGYLKQVGAIPTCMPYPLPDGKQTLRLPIAGLEAAAVLADETAGTSNEMLGSAWGIIDQGL